MKSIALKEKIKEKEKKEIKRQVQYRIQTNDRIMEEKKKEQRVQKLKGLLDTEIEDLATLRKHILSHCSLCFSNL